MTKPGKASISLRQLAAFHAAVITALPELDSKARQSWIEKPAKLREALRWALVQSNEIEPMPDNVPTFKLTVDYSLSLADMIAAGKYSWVNEQITDKQFPGTKQGTAAVELILVYFAYNTTTAMVEAELDKHGLRPATIAELLAFGAAQPELQRRIPMIVALGSRCVLSDGENVPVLYGSDSAREITLVCNDKGWCSHFRFLVVRKIESATDNLPTFTVTVDYSLSLADMIAAGKYDWVNGEITDKQFPGIEQGTSAIELVLVHLDRYATTEEVEAELERRGLRAANIAELLSLSAAHPELQRQFPIVALGSRCVLNGSEFVPVLYRNGSERALSLNYDAYEWSVNYRFLAVRKPATAGK